MRIKFKLQSRSLLTKGEKWDLQFENLLELDDAITIKPTNKLTKKSLPPWMSNFHFHFLFWSSVTMSDDANHTP